jgi:hypothetical protein
MKGEPRPPSDAFSPAMKLSRRCAPFASSNRSSFAAPLAATLAAAALALSAQPLGGGCSAAASTSTVGVGAGGAFGVPSLQALGQPDIDGSGGFAFRITGGVPGAPGLLLISRNEQPTFSTTYQTTLYAGPTPVFVPFQFDALGEATVAPRATSAPIVELCGRPLIAQATAFDFTATGGAGWSQGLRFTFGVVAPAR